MKIIDCLQYSPEWWEVRRGIPTASCFNRIFTAKTMKPSSQQEGYITQLIADTLRPDAPFLTERSGHTEAMRNGTNTEPEARKWYMVERDCEVCEVGFCLTDDGRFGCSPDGLIVGDGEAEWAGALELKCPMLKTQIGYVLAGEVPGEYLPQVHGQLIVTGLPWVDFMSYAPPAEPLLIRVERSKYTDALEEELERFWKRYQAVLERFAPKGEITLTA